MATTSDNTLTEAGRVSIQIRIPGDTWDRMKIQAIREKTTRENLAAKAFDAYLAINADGSANA